MKQFLLFLLVTAVTNAYIHDADLKTRKKRDPQWNWGTTGQEQSPGQSTRQAAPDSVCAPYNPPTPDFRAPGRRKCEVKCYEYIWGIKKRDDQAKRTSACQRHLQMNGTLPRFKTAVVGGHITQPGEYPHMGAVGWKAAVGTWVFKCGGSLISDKFVLTAGHCSRADPRDTTVAELEPKIVRLGDKNIIDIAYQNLGPRDSKIRRMIVHPKYAAPKKYNDIALIELEGAVQIDTFIQPACLWSKLDLNGLKSATVTGWGVVESGGKTTSPELQAASVDIMDNQQCDSLLLTACNRNWCGMQEDQLCAGKLAGGVDTCQGDSGGPIQVKLPLPENQGRMHTVVGVTSFGVGCAKANLPGVYTRVASFVDWIEGIVWP